MSEEEFLIKYLPAAKRDLEEMISYIQSDNLDAALNLINDIDKTAYN